MINTYKKGEIKFKDLNINWNYKGDRTTEDGVNEIFNIEIIDDKKNKIEYDFNNSIIEKQISDVLENKINTYMYDKLTYIKKHICKYWGGYDNITNLYDLSIQRQKNLIYSVISCLFNDLQYKNLNFYDFCTDFGYNKDSINDLKLYDECVKLSIKINSLYFNFDYEYIKEESKQFIKEIENLFK